MKKPDLSVSLLPLFVVATAAFGIYLLRVHEVRLGTFEVVPATSIQNPPVRKQRLLKKEGYLARRVNSGKIMYSPSKPGRCLQPGQKFIFHYGILRSI